MWPHHPAPRCSLNRNAFICSPKDTCKNVHSGHFHKHTKLETIQMPVHRRPMNYGRKFRHRGIVRSNEKEPCVTARGKMDESHKPQGEGQKPGPQTEHSGWCHLLKAHEQATLIYGDRKSESWLPWLGRGSWGILRGFGGAGTVFSLYLGAVSISLFALWGFIFELYTYDLCTFCGLPYAAVKKKKFKVFAQMSPFLEMWQDGEGDLATYLV